MYRGKHSIPTTYNGIQYRSRLEADWARFFDRHRIRFAYESEGFDLDGIWYLPDFYLPDIKTFVEVKGALDDIDREKVFALARVCAVKDIQVILAEAPAGERYRAVWPTPCAYKFHERMRLRPGPDGKPDPSANPLGYLPFDEWIAAIADSRKVDDKILFHKVSLEPCSQCGIWRFTEYYPEMYCPACGAVDTASPEQLNSFHEDGRPWR